MSKNLILPSGNNLVITGGNLVLSAEIITITDIKVGVYKISPLVMRSGGFFSIKNNFQESKEGISRIKGSFLTSLCGNFNITPTAMSMRGYSRIYNTFLSESIGKSRIKSSTLWNNFIQKVEGNYSIRGTYRRNEYGKFSIFQSLLDSKCGRIRVENSGVEGYVVYIGHDAMPDFSSITSFSATLPIEIETTPPEGVAEELYIVIRKRNRYGIESQNQKPYILKIEPTGEENLGEMTPPENITINPVEGESFLVHATYSGLATDSHPATKWNIYFKENSVPVPGVDTPVSTGDISDNMSVNIGPYSEGGKTYYLVVSVYRDDDAEEVAGEAVEIVLQDDPLTPVSIGGGYEEV